MTDPPFERKFNILSLQRVKLLKFGLVDEEMFLAKKRVINNAWVERVIQYLKKKQLKMHFSILKSLELSEKSDFQILDFEN